MNYDDETTTIASNEDWKSELQTSNGGIKRSAFNVHLILTNEIEWANKIEFDEFANRTKFNGENWTDNDTQRVQTWLSKYYWLEMSCAQLDSIIEQIAKENSYHPVRKYLRSLDWDGKERLPTFLNEIFGAEKSKYVSEVGRMWMISAVARIMQPGCQADSALILVSEDQGLGKSTAAKILSKGWSADSSIDIGSKDAMQNLQGVWIYELAELSSVRSARDVETVKQFISSRIDRYRSSYGRRAADHPRQVILIGTTNNTKCLHDRENRRFWPVDVSTIDLDRLTKEVDQLWAEAFARYSNGERWYPDTAELKSLIKERGEDHTEIDPWQEPVSTYLENYNLSALNRAAGITSSEILLKGIGLPIKDQTKAHEMRLSLIMRSLGYSNSRIRLDDGTRPHRWVRAA